MLWTCRPWSKKKSSAIFFRVVLEHPSYTIFSMILYMYTAPGQGQTGHKVLMSTEMPCHFIHLLQVSKKCLWSLILYISFYNLYMYIAPGQRQTALRGQILMSTERPYHFTHLLQVSKKSLWSLILYTVHKKSCMVGIWISLVNRENTKLSELMYKIMLNESNQGNRFKWIDHIKEILTSAGQAE